MATARKVVITCAVTGSIHTPSMSPHLPVTPDEIAQAAIAAAEEGATILHLHAREPEDGRPTQDPEMFRNAGHRLLTNHSGNAMFFDGVLCDQKRILTDLWAL